MKCEICGEAKRDLLLRAVECTCHNRHASLEVEGNRVVKVGQAEKRLTLEREVEINELAFGNRDVLKELLAEIDALRADLTNKSAKIGSLNLANDDLWIENEKLKELGRMSVTDKEIMLTNAIDQLRARIEKLRQALYYYREVYPEPFGKEIFTRRAIEALAQDDEAGK